MNRSRGDAAADLRWRVRQDGPGTGARNMALDHALAEALEADGAVLRLYEWLRPTVSFGRNEPTGEARPAGVDFVRRPTGGRAVLHARELTYAAVFPARALGGPRSAYRVLSEALLQALRALGVEARVVAPSEGRVRRLDAGACFGHAAPGELVVDGRKLVGSAQARIGGALLQHGSILLEDEQRRLGGGDGGAIGLCELLDEVRLEEVRAAVVAAFRERLGGRWGPSPRRSGEEAARADEEACADRLERTRYGRDAWTWRR